MRTCYNRPWICSLFLCLSDTALVRGSLTPFLPQSFFFDWNTPSQPVPIPTTEQCQTIHISWQRGTALGPNPVSPYYLQVYTSTFTTPFVIPAGNTLSFDWAVPFAPGTMYEICMFDKNGNTGGCQAIYTVIPPSQPPSCANVTYPTPLDVDAEVNNGPMSQYGWIDQCTDISVTPKNGTPPYTLTVAPALHPPYNITTPQAQSINWTVSLSWASPFFVSLVDGNGNSWSNGPLHSGGGGTTACLSGSEKAGAEVKPVIAIGAGVGGLAIGLLCGMLAAYIFLRRKYKKHRTDPFPEFASPADQDQFGIAYDGGRPTSQYRPIPTTSSSGITNSPRSHHESLLMGRMGSAHALPYQFEPLVMPDEEGRMTQGHRSPTSAYAPSNVIHTTNDHVPHHAPLTPPRPPASPPHQSQVYVLHHDSNVPPVTIFHQEGTRVVELPPRYHQQENVDGSDLVSEVRTGSDSRSDGSRSEAVTEQSNLRLLSQVRRPGSVQKPPRNGPS